MSVIDVNDGTLRAQRRTVGPFAISEIVFAPDVRLPRHEHPHSCIAVVVCGRVRKSYARAEHEAARGALIAMPAHEAHADLFGTTGARLIVVEGTSTVEHPLVVQDWQAAAIAHRMRGELARPDELSPLALEGLALELAALVGRRPTRAQASWVDDAADILRRRFRNPPSPHELAAEVGVHPAHLARCFRARLGESVGSYVRGVRLDWAADRLVRSELPLARIACEAGFADQSHFTRSFAARFGVSPGRYRAAHR
jgi:AraC family transcriptional regulator